MNTYSQNPDDENFIDIDTLFGFNDNSTISSEFLKEAMNVIFFETMNQLIILRQLNTRNCDMFDPFVIQYQTIEERITVTENYGNTRLPAVGTNEDKVAHDINIFVNLFKETAMEIYNFGTFEILKNTIKSINRMDRNQRDLFQSKENNEKMIKWLQAQCEEERIASMKAIEETNEKIQKVKFELEDVTAYMKTENQFFKSYEKARREQNYQKCKIKENQSLDVIVEIKEKIELEQKCHSLFLDYINEDMDDLLEMTENWSKLYYNEVERRERELLTLKGKLDYTADVLEKLTMKYNRRQAEIDKWNEYKRMKQEKEEEFKQKIWAIMKIQAWWRGTMVRRGIPPGGQRQVTKSKKSRATKASKSKKKKKK